MLDDTRKKIIRVKIKAFFIHGLITLFIGMAAGFLVYRVWYPGELSEMLRATGLYVILLGVELSLGPVMSLVIYNPKKPLKELVRDYSIVGVVQLGALLYGLYVVSVSRPVFLVFVKDQIKVVSAAELDKQDLVGDYRSLPWFGAKGICTESPTDLTEKSELLFSAIDGKDIELQPKYYRECHDGEVLGHAYSKPELEDITPIKLLMLPEALQLKEFVWFPVSTRYGTWIAVYVDGAEMDEVVYLDLDPYG